MALSTDQFLVKHWILSHTHLPKQHIQSVHVHFKEREMYFIRLEESIHYQTLFTDDFRTYSEYIHSTQQLEHTVDQFQSLRLDWNEKKMMSLRFTVEKGRVIMIDGVHRASIYVFLTGNHSIPYSYIHFEFQKSTLQTIEHALQQTTKSHHSNGWSNDRAPYGYHSFDLWNLSCKGQRNPKKRLDIMRQHYNFTGKTLVDIGCNTGGMMFHCLELKSAYGTDMDVSSIEAAKIIQKQLVIFPTYQFTVANFDECEPSVAFPSTDVDVVFLLSLGSWIKKWKEVYIYAVNHASTIFLETNNDGEGNSQLALFTELDCDVTMISAQSTDDCTGNHGRKLYMISKKIESVQQGK